jgi:hypothetical protein
MTVRLSAATLLVALAVLAAGCGADDDEPGAEAWAGDVCSALSDWRTSVQEAVESVQSNPSEDTLRQAADDAGSATDDLVSALKGLDRPETDAGQEAQAAVDDLAGDLETARSAIDDAVDGASGAGLLQAVSTIATALSTLQTEVSSTLDRIEGLDGGQELKDAFESSDSCDELRRDRS